MRSVGVACLLALSAGGVVWDKPESAQARSAATGTPICYYFTQDAALKEGGTWAGATWSKSIEKANGSFVSDPVAKRSNEFIFVKGTQKLANQFGIKGSPAALIVDPDGAELARGSLAAGEPALTALFDKAAAKYAPKAVDWASEVSTSSKPLLVVGFETEGDTLKGFEDRMLAKYHDKITFVKLPYEKGSELAKKWQVSTLPSIYICDASKEAPEKSVLEKLTGAKKPVSLKLAVQKALFKIEKK